MSENVSERTESAHEIPAQATYTQPLARVSAARTALIKYARIVVICDALVLLVSAAAALASRFSASSTGLKEIAYAALSAGVSLTVLGFQGAYGVEGLQSLPAQRRSITRAAPVVFAIIAAVSYSSKDQFSRGFLLLFAAIAYTSLLAERWMVSRLILRRTDGEVVRRRSLIIGSTDIDESTLKLAQLRPVMTMAGAQGGAFESWLASVIAAVNRNDIDVVLLSQTHDLEPKHIQRLSWALEGSVDLIEQASLASLGRRAFLRVHNGVGFLHLVELDLIGPKRIIKRTFDIAFSTVLLILLSPLFVLVAVAVKLTSPGPVFFVQPRIGQNGTPFPFPKFRSMRVGAHLERQELLGTPDEAMLQRYQSDPRITAVGRVIRRFSIDELPQLWSVLRGHMSVVGPRPILEEELQLLENADFRRHAAKPGLTGLWQVSGRKEVPWNERMMMDVAYLENWSLTADLVLVARTVISVLRARGAI